MSKSNIGQVGPESIRLNGDIIDSLPIAEAVNAKVQMAEVYKTDRENKIAGIRARYPPQRVDYMEARIAEAQQNISRIGQVKQKDQQEIGEYRGLISLCEHRDKALEKTQDIVEINGLKKRFPPYNVEAMKQQIVQFEKSIASYDRVIAREHNDIAMMTELLGQCKARDLEIARIK